MNRRGAAAEALAESFLNARGLAIAHRNYRCRFGEIDLIARDGTTLVFVEVRQRRYENYGSAAESITAAKRARLLAAARHYLARTGDASSCRFDVVLIRGDEQRIEWIRNAFCE